VVSIAHALPVSELVSYVNGLSLQELEPLFGHLPEGVAHTKEELVRVIQSSQFQQGMGSLSSVLMQSGVGALVANQLGYEYCGEGVEALLNGARNAGKKDKEQHENDDQMQE
jgi:hypothetical protein